MRYDQAGNISLTGNAVIRRPAERISAEALHYHFDPERIFGEGNLWLESPQLLIHAERGEINPQARTGTLENAAYWLVDHHASGEARRVVQQDAARFRLSDPTFSTCPAGQRSWELKAERIDLDRESGRGVARHTTLHAGDLPVMYLPWISFPIDDRRQTGFLYPTLGSSSGSGFELAAPWYWNIAPQADATFIPRLMSRRGLGLDSEGRYLHQQGQGVARLNLLPNDRQANRSRWQAQLRHNAGWDSGLITDLRIDRVSDDRYLQDFSNSLEEAATDNLETAFRAGYRAGNWQLGLLAQQYQTVSPLVSERNRPYRILPRVTASWRQATQLGPLTARGDLQSSLSRFDHPSELRSTGSRLWATPALSAEFSRPFVEIVPRLALDLRHYQLSRGKEPARQGAADRITRTTPVASIDSRLLLERQHGENHLGVLEPRLYYLYVPYRNQAAIPNFDSGLASFSYAQLFTPNRYTGGDRLGDANLVTYALSWSLIDTRQGLETLGLRLAQQYRFSDSRVQLYGEGYERGPSTVITEASSQFHPNWQTSLTTEYDTDQSRLGRTHAHLRYRGGDGRILNMGYTYKPETARNDGFPNRYRQGDVSFMYPASRQWSLIGRLGYSFDENRLVRSLAGIGYDSCCWGLRLAAQRYVVNPDRIDDYRYRNAVMLQVELKGLGDFGQTGGLREAIPGFSP